MCSFWHQDSADSTGAIDGVAEAFDSFGSALAVGDFDGNGFDDLAVGVPDEAVGSLASAGAVNVIYSASGTGLAMFKNQIWTQGSSQIAGVSEAGDRFGKTLAAGNFTTATNADDLAIGAPGEAVGEVKNSGAVNIIYGETDNGLTYRNNTIFHYGKNVNPYAAQTDAGFGSTLFVSGYPRLADNGSGWDSAADLLVGVPKLDLRSESGELLPDAGIVHFFYGDKYNGLTTKRQDFTNF